MSSTTQGSTPAGWYTDPADDTGYRWWDGSTWTTHTRRTENQDPGTSAAASPVATVTEVRAPEARHAAPVPAAVPSVELQPFAPLVPTPSPPVTSSAAVPVQQPAAHTDGGAIAAYQAPAETGWSGFGQPPAGTPGYGAPAYGQPGFGTQGYGESAYGAAYGAGAYAQPATPVPPAPGYQAAPFAPVAGYASPPPPGLPPFTGAAYPAVGGYPTPGYPAPGYPAGNGYPAAGYSTPYGYGAPTGVATDVKWLPWLGVLAVLLGFVGLFGFLGVFSVVQASRVRRRIAMTGEPGEGRAVAGLVLGIIGLVLWVGNLVLRVMTTSF